jgi:hypothetical protein
VSKSTHEWPRMTTSDHEWPRVTTNDTLTMLSWTLQCATFVLKVRHHGNSVLRIRLKICLFSAILKIHSGNFRLLYTSVYRNIAKHLKLGGGGAGRWRILPEIWIFNKYLRVIIIIKLLVIDLHCHTKFREKTGVWGSSPRKLFHFWNSRTAILAFSKVNSQTNWM